MKVEFYRHNIRAEEKEKVAECLDGIFLTTGMQVAEFEEKFTNYLDLKHTVGLTSCTAALHLSFIALGIESGDEVITTPMTFIATATTIIHAGAKPVFVDVEKDTGLINPDLIEAAISEKTKAILPVHLYGQMCDMRRIRAIADKYDLKVIEDCAHCIEGERDGVRPGQLGDIACFSFYATKNITCGEGGAIATNDLALADRIRLLRQHGMSKGAASRYGGNYQHWDMLECGWKYNMDNIKAAMLLPQIDKIDDSWERRNELYGKYLENLETMPNIDRPKIVEECKSAHHLFTIWVDPSKRDEMLRRLGENEIGVAVNYRAIHLLQYFRERFGYKQGDFPIAEKIGSCTISLPFYISLRDEELNYVFEKLENFL